jgi:pyridoxamine 5'-phosphate oxidase
MRTDVTSPADLRKEFQLASLRRADLESDPIAQFQKWFADAAGATRHGRFRAWLIRCYKAVVLGGSSESAEANAASLATIDSQGRPSVRIVLLKGVDARGFIFFTNYESRKGRDLDRNPNAALGFYWSNQERQVSIAGTVARLPRDESEAYFQTRPKGSQLGAWASRQSEVIENRAVLEQRWREAEGAHPGGSIPLPPSWGGYVISPNTIEFWQGRPSRLHDRFRYSRQANGAWRIDRLSP